MTKRPTQRIRVKPGRVAKVGALRATRELTNKVRGHGRKPQRKK